jgi:hypothetical protein
VSADDEEDEPVADHPSSNPDTWMRSVAIISDQLAVTPESVTADATVAGLGGDALDLEAIVMQFERIYASSGLTGSATVYDALAWPIAQLVDMLALQQ